jgi:hypothetical protein
MMRGTIHTLVTITALDPRTKRGWGENDSPGERLH